MKKKVMLFFLAASFVLASANLVGAVDEKPPVTAKALIQMVISNLTPPPGFAFSGSGTFHTSAENSDLCLLRAVNDTEEAFLAQFNSPVTGAMGGTERPGLQYKGIRWYVSDGNAGVYASTFPPTLGRGRKLQWVPNDGILGGDLAFYDLHPVSVFSRDFLYRLVVWDLDYPRLDGIRLPGLPIGIAPYGSSRITLQRVSITYVPTKVEYWDNDQFKGPPVKVVEYTDYHEVLGADGYWAPNVVTSGSTSITFGKWYVTKSPENMFTRNHALLGTREISCRAVPSQN